jgi:hypothetical protein
LYWANREGVPINVLKGGLLSLKYYPDPAIRPMADLDLLIRPHHVEWLSEKLAERGYQRETPEHEFAARRHTRFRRADEKVVSWDSEHPDNPMPIEVHTRLDSPLWGDVTAEYLPEKSWEHSLQTTLLGEPAWVFQAHHLLVHLSVHNLQHLMIQTGRALQWLDLAHVAAELDDLSKLTHPEWCSPALTLTSRCFPNEFPDFDLSVLSSHPWVKSWASTVPLNGRCGLNIGPPPDRRNKFWLHWERWRPSFWRLGLTYGHIPLPVALGRHLFSFLGHVLTRGLV